MPSMRREEREGGERERNRGKNLHVGIYGKKGQHICGSGEKGSSKKRKGEGEVSY